MKFKIFFLILLFLQPELFGQSDRVKECLQLIANGKTEAVKMQMADLLAEYPDDPGVMLVQAVVIDDAYRAVELYKKIVANHPKSQWADDALWRVIQFYAITHDTTAARQNLQKLKLDYPDSEFLAPAAEIVKSAVGIVRNEGKEKIDKKFTAPKIDITDEKIEHKEKPVATKDTKNENPDEAGREVGLVEGSEKKSTDINAGRNRTDENDNIKYGLQVGIYSNREGAESEMRRFLRQRMRTEIMEKIVNDKVMYSVVIGNYSSRASAEAAKKIVKGQCNCEPVIFKKD